MLKRLRWDPWGSLFIFCLLIIFWLLISESVDWQHIVTGVLFAALLTFFWNQLMGDQKERTNFSIRQLFRFFVYMACLGYEIVKANFVVAYIVLHPKLPISPGLISFRVNLQRDLARVLFANSITLTPGTVTVDLQGDRILVHAFTREAAEGVEHWYLYRMMQKIEAGDEPVEGAQGSREPSREEESNRG